MPDDCLKYLRKVMMEGRFNAVYELVEFLLQNGEIGSPHSNVSEKYGKYCNIIFERERSAFRFAERTLVKISNEEELKEISTALSQDSSNAVREHVKRSVELYSQPDSPDYRNSIKESISAVEAAVRFVTGKKTTGVAKPLRSIEEVFKIHPALRDGFEKLYAFTSDAEGIRHSLLDEGNLTQEDARYMLVSCSAFANYLIARKAAENS